MKKPPSSRMLPILILAISVSMISLAGTGCSPTIKQTLPQMAREQVTLKVKLDPKPYLHLSDDQVDKLLDLEKGGKLPVGTTVTIFSNQADWFAIYDEALAIQKGYEDYLADIFSGDKKKK